MSPWVLSSIFIQRCHTSKRTQCTLEPLALNLTGNLSGERIHVYVYVEKPIFYQEKLFYCIIGQLLLCEIY
jgi:hypothetical protein